MEVANGVMVGTSSVVIWIVGVRVGVAVRVGVTVAVELGVTGKSSPMGEPYCWKMSQADTPGMIIISISVSMRSLN